MWKFPGFLVLTFNSQKAHDIVEVFNVKYFICNLGNSGKIVCLPTGDIRLS